MKSCVLRFRYGTLILHTERIDLSVLLDTSPFHLITCAIKPYYNHHCPTLDHIIFPSYSRIRPENPCLFRPIAVALGSPSS